MLLASLPPPLCPSSSDLNPRSIHFVVVVRRVPVATALPRGQLVYLWSRRGSGTRKLLLLLLLPLLLLLMLMLMLLLMLMLMLMLCWGAMGGGVRAQGLSNGRWIRQWSTSKPPLIML